MPVLSPGRDAIFSKAAKTALQINGFPDFYALIGAARGASFAELETAITSRAADLLAASFSRGSEGEALVLVRRYLTEMRPILLDKATRAAYDEQLGHHESGDARALPYLEWQQTLASGNRVSRGLQGASRSFKERLKTAFWDAEYI